MNDLVLTADQFVIISDDTLKTTSLKIAEAFEKRHDHVIRDIRKIIEVTKDILTAPKFGECQRINELANNKVKITAWIQSNRNCPLSATKTAHR